MNNNQFLTLFAVVVGMIGLLGVAILRFATS